jgi:hypothetical protein
VTLRREIMPRLRPLILGLFAVACLSAAPVFADHSKALQGSMDVTNYPLGPNPGPDSLEIYGVGGGTETNVLGAFTVELDYDLNFEHTTPPFLKPTTFLGSIRFQTGKGELDGYFFGRYTAVGQFEALVFFVGGTGQFKDAYGYAMLDGQDGATPLVFHAEFQGSIRYGAN